MSSSTDAADATAAATKEREEDGGETTKTTMTAKGDGGAGDAASTDADDVPDGHSLIVEGSARMIYPSDDNTVFYNPVQVQNRDVSVLMISLYAERRLKARAAKARKKEMLDELRAKGVPQKEWDTKGLAQKAEAEMENVDWRARAKDTSKSEDGIRILEALAASGLRSVRYWQEIPGVRQVVINDLEDAAVELGRKNVAFNKLDGDLCSCSSPDDVNVSGEKGRGYYDGIRVQQSDATHEMYLSRRPPALRPENITPTQRQQKEQYDVIDLDPYGSASPFLDGAVQAVVSGGLLCVTCTDMAALGGSHPETCYGRYSGMPVQRAEYLQELALRILLKDVATCAARYGRSIRPVLSVGMAFYVRCFMEVNDDKKGVNDLSLSIGSVYQSARCPSFHTIPHGTFGHGNRNTYQPSRGPSTPQCSETGGPFKVAGPAWLGPLHDMDVVNEAVRRLELPNGTGTVLPLATRTPLHGLLTSVSEELPDVPLYYTLPGLCKTLGCQSPPLRAVRAALVNAGYRASAYHKESSAIKTDAPGPVVWDIMRAWCKEHPPKARGGGRSKKERRVERKKQHRARQEQKQKRGEGGEIGNDANGNSGGDEEMAEQPAETTEVNKDERRGGETDNGEAKKDDDDTKDSGGEHPPSIAALILAKEPTIEVDFTIPDGFEKDRKKAQRFPHNPQANWGPKPKASGGVGGRKRKAPEEKEGQSGTKETSGTNVEGTTAAKRDKT